MSENESNSAAPPDIPTTPIGETSASSVEPAPEASAPSEEQARLRKDAEALLTAHLNMLRGYMRHLTTSPEDAEDLAQEVCVEALKNPQILFRGSDAGAYLRGIARHLASRHHRRKQRDAVIEEIIDLAWGAYPRAGPGQTEQTEEPEQHALQRCLAKMQGRLRRMLAWRYEQNLTSNQIAEKLHMSSEAVRMALARTRQALAKCIRQQGRARG